MNLLQKLPKVRTDLIFFIIGFLVFPIVVIAAIYSIFNVKNDINTAVLSFPMDGIYISQEDSEQNGITGRISDPAETEPTQSSQDNPASPMTSSISTVRTGHSKAGLQKSLNNQSSISQTGLWSATQYSHGDIVEKTYVVQSGDTLWQIAAAYYGDGAQWSKILDNNSVQIGFLPSGEQALIYPNQILVLP